MRGVQKGPHNTELRIWQITAWSLARVKCGADLALLKASSTHARSQVGFFFGLRRTQEFSNLAWTFATLQHLEMSVMDMISMEALKKLKEFAVQHLGNTVWSLGKLGRCKDAAGRSYISWRVEANLKFRASHKPWPTRLVPFATLTKPWCSQLPDKLRFELKNMDHETSATLLGPLRSWIWCIQSSWISWHRVPQKQLEKLLPQDLSQALCRKPFL